MQKLMLLGGSRYLRPVIKAARDLGLFIITADYLPNNYAHQFADEYCNVSIVDKEATLKYAQAMNINGIMSFACDPGVVTAAYVAEKMGLPSVGSYEAVSILQNKKLFRKFLAENGFNVPTARGYTDEDAAIKDVDLFHWPVIVKPTDSAGSKGVKRVTDPKDLKEAIQYAISFSRKKEYIIEDFITQHGYSSDTDCFSVNGELKFISFNSQYFDHKAENPYTPAAYSWPSSISEEHQNELTKEIQRLIKLLKLKTSIYNIETREGTDGKAYIMECSPRGGGNRLAECLEYATGVKLIENAIRAAVDMPIIGIKQKPYDGYWAEVILHSNKPGIFKSLWIDESIQNAVYETDLWIKPGQTIGGFSAANEAIGTIVIRYNTKQELRLLLDDLPLHIKVIMQDD